MATIFSDGFESGDFSAWTSSNGSPSINDTIVYAGSYSALFDAFEWLQQNHDSQTTIYIQTRVNFKSFSGLDDGEEAILFRENWSASNDCPIIKNSGDTVYFGFIDSAGNRQISSVSVSLNTWYLLEFKISVGDEERLYINGVSVASGTAPGAGSSGTLYLGNWYLAGAHEIQVLYDNVQVADGYIGPETSIPVFMHHYTKNVWR